MTVSLLLYGSRARGDDNKLSDIDLLGIKADGAIKYRDEQQRVTLHEYPFSVLEKKASKGDLFLLHLVSEALALADDLNLLGALQKSFVYKDDYEEEMNEAAAVLWYCQSVVGEVEDSRLRKRLAWVIRTTIIADAANRKIPIFSSSDLEEYSEIENMKTILNQRSIVNLSELNTLARKVVKKYYRLIRPKHSSYRSVVRWMNSKGAVAQSTPAFLNNVVKNDFFHEFYM